MTTPSFSRRHRRAFLAGAAAAAVGAAGYGLTVGVQRIRRNAARAKDT